MDEKNHELIGREMRCFRGKGYVNDMRRLIGKVGKIINVHNDDVNNDVNVQFPDIEGSWWFSLDEALEHLVEEESIDLNQLFNQIKQI